MLQRLMHIHSPMLRDELTIAQLRYWFNSYSKYNVQSKALPLLMCTKNTALRDMSQDKYSIWICLVLHLSLDTHLILHFPYKLMAVL